jgi:glutamate-1-semialdehyde aminotransferase
VLAGLAFMKEAAKPYFYPLLQKIGSQLYTGLEKIIAENDLNMVVPGFGARFNILIGRKTPAKKYEETFCHDNQVFLGILKKCFEKGVYFHDYGGGPVHHGFSIQHTPEDISFVLNTLKEVLLINRNYF